MAQRTAFDTVPTELLLEIASYIRRLSDLKNLCLTCRAVRQSATSNLYQTVSIDLSKCTFPKLNGFFLHSNEGHRYVRGVFFHRARKCGQDPSAVLKIVRLCLRLLPRNNLRHIQLPKVAMDDETFLELCLTQQNLEEINFGSMDVALASILQLPAFPTNCFKALKMIKVPKELHTLHDLEIFHYALKQADALEKLLISSKTVTDDQENSNKLSDTENNDGELIKTLFGHIIPYGSAPPLKIHELILDWQPLLYAERTFATVIDFTQLETLQILRCTHAEALFTALTSKFRCNGALLRHLIYEGPALETKVMEAFLESFSGLKTLHLDYCDSLDSHPPGCPPQVKSLLRHSSSLSTVFISAIKSVDEHYTFRPTSNSQLEDLASKFSAIECLSVILPTITIREAEQDIWGDFGRVLDSIAKVPKLRVLSILNGPRVSHGTLVDRDQYESSRELQELTQRRYFEYLDQFADRVQRKIAVARDAQATSELPFLGFSTGLFRWQREEGGERKFVSIPPTFYLPVLQTSRFERSKITGRRMKTVDIEYLMSWWR